MQKSNLRSLASVITYLLAATKDDIVNLETISIHILN